MDFNLGSTISDLWEKLVDFLPLSPIVFIQSIPEVEKYLGISRVYASK